MTELPVIFLTAHAEKEDIIKGFELGAQDYVTKPFNGLELLARVDTHIQLKEKTERLEVLNRDITDSIKYAERIQRAMLPPTSTLAKLGEYQIIFMPRDLVSGDFYWFHEDDSHLYIAVADCTGHGVPGAFMSMMGISILNELFSSANPMLPAQVLDYVRQKLIATLHNKGDHEKKPMDGMDISLCRIDLDDGRLHFSGAYHSLYVLRNERGAEAELMEIKSDRMPVGPHPGPLKNFRNHTIDLKSSDSVYMLTDGYTSQFGGDRDVKFGYRRLRELLLSVSAMNMTDQRMELIKSLNEWSLGYPRVDDILIMGFKIK
jgi:serine phosphatase RsbU (regulator of sigma subunit)